MKAAARRDPRSRTRLCRSSISLCRASRGIFALPTGLDEYDPRSPGH
jgi:hypothetical protein